MIEIKNLKKSFGKHEILKGINLTIQDKEVVVIIGPSGSGKSTILRCINYLEEPTSGEIIVDGLTLDSTKKVNDVRMEVGMVFQRFNLFPHMTVLENIILAPVKTKRMTKEEATNVAIALLEKVGLSDKKELISSILKNSEFLKDNEVLQSAYLLGMMSAGLINRQFAISKNSSFEKWLNNAGLITKELLERIWTKCDETNKKLSNVSRGKRSANIEIMRDILIGILPSAFLSQKRVKSAYVTLAFAMGGSDFTKYIKDNTQGDE